MAKSKTTRRTTKGSKSNKKRTGTAKRPAAKKRTAKTARKAAAKKPTPPNPPGFNTVNAHLQVHNAAQAIEFYGNAFGARPRNLQTTPDGRIFHVELKIGDSVIMLADEMPLAPVKSPRAIGATTSVLHIFSDNVDRMWERATKAGAEVLMPLENQFWEQRYGQIKDPFGHVWALAQPVKMTKQEIQAKQREMQEQMAATFGGAPEPPGRGNGGRERDILA